MAKSEKDKDLNSRNLLRRLRESANLTMRQAAGLIGISHVAISQFENGKLRLPAFRVDQMVKAYGITPEEFRKLSGYVPAVDPYEGCRQALTLLNGDQAAALYSLLNALVPNGRSRESAEPNKRGNVE